MHLGHEDIGEFTRHWKVAFGETLTAEQARAQATSLLEFYAHLAQPIEPPVPDVQDEHS